MSCQEIKEMLADVVATMNDGLFMSSRDGRHFERWGKAFLRPGRHPMP